MAGRSRVVILDADGVIGELHYFLIGQAEALAFSVGSGTFSVLAAVGRPHRSGASACHRASGAARRDDPLESRLMHVKLIGIDAALDDVFAEPIDAGNEHDIAEIRTRYRA